MSGSNAAAAGLTVAIALGLTGAALAQDASSAPAQPSPPSPDALARCAQLPSDAERLQCYDAAMRSAGFGPKPAEVAAEHRKQFGLPKLSLLKRHNKHERRAAAARGGTEPAVEDNPDRVTVKVLQVAAVQPTGRMLVVTGDGQIWEQIDTTAVTSMPKQGDSMLIRRGALGSYFCEANKYQEVHCKRER